MLVKYILRNSFQSKTIYRPYFRNFSNTNEPSEKSEKVKSKGLHIVITPKKILYGAVALSWVFLLKLWYDAQDIVRERAQEYYDKGGAMDKPVPEEYRREYADKLKRKIKKKKEGDEGKISEVTIVTGSNKN